MRALIFANGDPTSRTLVEQWMQPDSIVIAADGGARNARAIGVTPDTVIGDLDSLDGGLRADLESHGTRFIVHPTHKDETDLELAIHHALGRGASDLVIFSALGGRWDQSLGNILLLTSPALRNVPARLVDPQQMIIVVRSAGENETHIAGQAGDTLSLIALGGDAHGVTIEGCEYPLNGAVLPFGVTLGISNTLIAPEARVRVSDGVVLIVHSRNE
jgi:thiamine pyrophosphokinase